MRKLMIHRKKSFIGCLLVVQVMCDGHIVGSIRSGETTEINIDENAHTIYCVADAPGEYGGSNRRTSDVINVPVGTDNIKMEFSFGFSFKLSLI